jgi:hypothetical protein
VRNIYEKSIHSSFCFARSIRIAPDSLKFESWPSIKLILWQGSQNTEY